MGKAGKVIGLLVIVLILVIGAWFVFGQDFLLNPIEELCSESEVTDYVINYAGTAEQLINQFDAFCAGIEDYGDCNVYYNESVFEFFEDAPGVWIAEASCEISCTSNPTAGFSIIWIEGMPREVVQSESYYFDNENCN